MLIELVDGHILFTVGEDGAGEVKDFSETVALADILERARIIFSGEEVVAVFEPETLANVFEGVGVRPADANGIFRQEPWLACADCEWLSLPESRRSDEA